MRLFDLHCDTLSAALNGTPSPLYTGDRFVPAAGGAFTPWVQTMAAYLPDTLRGEAARRACLAMLAVAARWQRRQPAQLPLLTGTRCPQPAFSGCQAMLSVEGGGAFGDAPEFLCRLADAGVKLISLTWNGDNAWASGCMGTPDGGLTAAGEQALQQMERLAITPDVSHLNAAGFWQVAARCRRPFIASHSDAAAVLPHPRNLTDEQFVALREAGGLVGLNLYPGHLGGLSFAQLRRHLEHFLSLDGERTVCIGSDLDGFMLPDGVDGYVFLAGFWQYLAEAGYPADLLDRIFYENARSFFFGSDDKDKGE